VNLDEPVNKIEIQFDLKGETSYGVLGPILFYIKGETSYGVLGPILVYIQ